MSEAITHNDIVQALRNAIYIVLTAADEEHHDHDDSYYEADTDEICQHLTHNADKIAALVRAYFMMIEDDNCKD